jgi:threonine dehydratase
MTAAAPANAFAHNSGAGLSFAEVAAAAERLRPHLQRTPCRHSRTLSKITGAEVWVKFENLQFTAAFKERGALNKLLLLTPEEAARGVIAASAGNHAQGLAYHGQRLGVPTVIVMPRTTPRNKVVHTEDFGAEVILAGDTFDEAAAEALRLQAERGLTLVHPFNDPHVMAGQGTTAMEMLEDAPDLDALVVPVGGGGLIAGMATAAKTLKPDVRIFAVQAAMYPSFAAKMRHLPSRAGGATIAEGIAVKVMGEFTYAAARPLVDDVLLVEEGHLETAVALYANVEKTVAEGAGAASLAALLAYPERFRGQRVGVLLSGGNIDSRLLASVLTRDLVREQRIVSLRVVGDDRPGLLASVSALIGQAGANIISIAHDRLALDVPAKGAVFDIMIETRDADHSRRVTEVLRDHGHVLQTL